MNRLIAASLLSSLVLAGCASRSPAPVDDRRPAPTPQAKPAAKPVPPVVAAPPAPQAARPGHYIVKRGDTLYSIALEHGADYRDVARWNNLDDPSKIRVGQELRVASPDEPAGGQVSAVRGAGPVESRPIGGSPAQASPAPQAAAPGAAPKTSPQALRLPYSEQNLARLSRGDAAPAPSPQSAPKPEPQKPAPAAAPAPAPSPAPAQAAAPDKDPDATIDFGWPAKGRVIAGFSEPSNKGLDISGKPGDPVVAAAAGRVMYVGTGIRGYGKLIVIKHDNNFNSVYAHNREILVKEGQAVTKGQKIAELGDTDADQPKLHFEIRQSGKPVDPSRFLPRQ